MRPKCSGNMFMGLGLLFSVADYKWKWNYHSVDTGKEKHRKIQLSLSVNAGSCGSKRFKGRYFLSVTLMVGKLSSHFGESDTVSITYYSNLFNGYLLLFK